MTERIAKTIDRDCEDLEFAFVAELVARQGTIQAKPGYLRRTDGIQYRIRRMPSVRLETGQSLIS
ncbi:MAG: hypothetical protein NXI02_18250 [Rhodobacteraceae bacterium]|nr:hypothetical protein [Paracoccaceae bacterium]